MRSLFALASAAAPPRAGPIFGFILVFVAAAACIDAPIESAAPDADDEGDNGNGNGNGGVECPDTAGLDVGAFEDDPLPNLEQNCTGPACHDPGVNEYEVDGADPEASLASFIEFADCGDPDESEILRLIDGRETHTGGGEEQLGDSIGPVQDYLAVLADAAGGGGGGGPGFEAFESDVQPILDSTGDTGCAEGAGCHSGGIGGFTLHVDPAPGSAEMEDNFQEVLGYVEPGEPEPEDSELIDRATDGHYPGDDMAQGDVETIQDWILSL